MNLRPRTVLKITTVPQEKLHSLCFKRLILGNLNQLEYVPEAPVSHLLQHRSFLPQKCCPQVHKEAFTCVCCWLLAGFLWVVSRREGIVWIFSWAVKTRDRDGAAWCHTACKAVLYMQHARCCPAALTSQLYFAAMAILLESLLQDSFRVKARIFSLGSWCSRYLTIWVFFRLLISSEIKCR